MYMHLPFLSKNQGQKEEFYFGLFLKESSAVGFVFKVKHGLISIVTKEKCTYTNGWDTIVNDIDDLVSRLENQTKNELTKTIFFVYSHLIDRQTQEIKIQYLQGLKEIVKNLDLKPLGYIECYEGVISGIQQTEQTALTAILIELDATNLDFFIYKGGKKMYFESVKRTDNLTNDLEAIFAQKKESILFPSRIILYNSGDLDEEATKIIAHRWSPEFFVQLPRVEVMKEDTLYQGLSHVFLEQIKKEHEEEVVLSPTHNTEKEVLGFIIGGDVAEWHPPSIKMQMPKFHIPSIKLNKVLIFVSLAIIIIASLVLSEIYLHKAKIIIRLPTKTISHDIHVSAPTFVNNKEEVYTYIATISGQFNQTQTVTGKREIGDKASGEVTLHSFDDKEKTFAKSTILSAGSLRFSLDSDVKVASASIASDGSAKLPGKAKGKVTAVDIGADGNIDKNQRFTIADMSSSIYFGINERAFSGGTKKEVRTVAKQDIEDLEKVILEKAKVNGLEQIKKTIKNEDVLIEGLSEFTFDKQKFSKEIGEEASSLSLNTTINTTYYFFKKNELINKLVKSAQSEIPPGYSIMKDTITYSIKKAKKASGIIDADLLLKGKTIKEVSREKVMNDLVGKTPGSIDSQMKSHYDTVGSIVQIQPSVFPFTLIMPFFKKNINLRFSS